MRLSHYLCLDPCKGWLANADDDDSPLIKVEFMNELRRLSREEKMDILDAMAASTLKVLTPKSVPELA